MLHAKSARRVCMHLVLLLTSAREAGSPEGGGA